MKTPKSKCRNNRNKLGITRSFLLTGLRGLHKGLKDSSSPKKSPGKLNITTLAGIDSIEMFEAISARIDMDIRDVYNNRHIHSAAFVLGIAIGMSIAINNRGKS